jgi:aspartate ammonia-lyase
LKPQDYDESHSRLYEYNETELEVNQLQKTLDENNEEFRHVRHQGWTRLQVNLFKAN